MVANNSIAIIGLDAQFGQCTNIDEVERALYLGNSLGNSSSNNLGNSQGNSAADHLADICLHSLERLATANQLALSELNLVVISSSPLASLISPDETTLKSAVQVSTMAQAISLSQKMLAQQQVVALVGVNLLASFATDNSAEEKQHNNTISFDQSFQGYGQTNGVASVLLANEHFVQQYQPYVYSWITGFACGEITDVCQVSKTALANANVTSHHIGLLEVSALAEPILLAHESAGLMNVYDSTCANEEKLTTAISAARSITGEGLGFSQVLGLLRTAMSLQQRYIPAISHWQQPLADSVVAWQNSHFYFPTEARPWYPHADASSHLAAYSCVSAPLSSLVTERLTENLSDALPANSCQGDDYCHLILQENLIKVADERYPAIDVRKNGFIASSSLKLILLCGANQDELHTQLAVLAKRSETTPLAQLGQEYFIAYEQRSSAQIYCISLLSESIVELNKEITLATAGIDKAFAELTLMGNATSGSGDWKTPKGSFFTAIPVSSAEDNQNVSFLYPGIGATYIGLGRDLFHLFPDIYQGVAALADDIGSSLKDTLLNPRSIVRPSFNELKQLDLDLRGNLAHIAEAGVGFACVFTKVFEDVFNVKADFATGYSMGEVSMYAALGCWQQPGLMSARLAQSATFNHRLCGELQTLREHWGLADKTSDDEIIWETYTIKATLAEVEAATIGEDRVYCTIINTPDSLLLAGYPADCLRVIKKLGVRAMALNMANAIHSAPANKEYNDMVELYTMDVTERIKTKMYSSSCYLPIPQLSKAIAHSIAKCLCDQVDFPRLVNTLHDKGARVFIEMGPGRSLCSWVDKILADGQAREQHVAVPVNAKGTSDELTYFRALAKLASHGVTLDLNSLFNGSIVVNKNN